MLRLVQQSEVLNILKPYLDDVGRRDIPVGLWQSIDVLVEGLLPGGADPVIHFDDHYMYSTADLVTAVQGGLAALGVAYPDSVVRPVVFFLPGTDPSNALLMPILAHEVGHTAVEQNSLGSKAFKRVDAVRLNTLFDDCLQAAGNPPPGPWQVQLFRWMDELLCDALATVLTGPSLLFASATFLPAPDPGTLGSHPFPADRLRISVQQLKALGWSKVLQESIPKTLAWLESLKAPPPTDDRERFLRGAVDIIEPALFEVAKSHAKQTLTPADFGAVSGDLVTMIQANIPPAQVKGRHVDPWAITLAAWIYQFSALGDTPKSLAVAVADRKFNAFVHKSIEMAGITRLWESA
jgi:hypothetical protein